jgi:peptide chain release factor 3
VFFPQTGTRHAIVGVIGTLQFDVIEARLSAEYGIPCTLDRLPHTAARWPIGAETASLTVPMGVMRAVDRKGREVLLFQSPWEVSYAAEKNPGIEFRDTM